MGPPRAFFLGGFERGSSMGMWQNGNPIFLGVPKKIALTKKLVGLDFAIDTGDCLWDMLHDVSRDIL